MQIVFPLTWQFYILNGTCGRCAAALLNADGKVRLSTKSWRRGGPLRWRHCGFPKPVIFHYIRWNANTGDWTRSQCDRLQQEDAHRGWKGSRSDSWLQLLPDGPPNHELHLALIPQMKVYKLQLHPHSLLHCIAIQLYSNIIDDYNERCTYTYEWDSQTGLWWLVSRWRASTQQPAGRRAESQLTVAVQAIILL